MAGLIAPVARLIEEFSKLPGVGTKTAQRLAYHVLRTSPDDARALAGALIAVKEEVAYCSTCCNITEVGNDLADRLDHSLMARKEAVSEAVSARRAPMSESERELLDAMRQSR